MIVLRYRGEIGPRSHPNNGGPVRSVKAVLVDENSRSVLLTEQFAGVSQTTPGPNSGERRHVNEDVGHERTGHGQT